MAELNEPISDREKDVLELLIQGATNKEIGASLFISPNTVKVHLRNINTKLGARSRTEASKIALERGLIVLPGMEPTKPEQEGEVNVEAEVDVDVEDEAVLVESVESESPPFNQASRSAIEPEQGGDTYFSRLYWVGGLFLVLLLLAIVGWFALNARTAEPVPPIAFEPENLGDQWFKSQKLPESLSDASAVAVGTHIYLFGGRQADGMLNDELHIYDSAEHMWRTVAHKVPPVSDGAVALLEGQIYMIGGKTADGETSDVVAVYSPAKDNWQFAANLPQPLSNGLALTDGSQLYYLGGEVDGTAVANGYLFDPSRNVWSDLPDMPEARSGAAGGIVDGHVYLMGGGNKDGEATASCFQLDLTDNTWESCTPMGNTRSHAVSTVILRKIYVVGGVTGAKFGEVYNPESRLWEKIDEPMLEDLDSPIWADAGIAKVENRVYVLGGEFNGTLSRDAFFYAPLVYQSFIPSASSADP